MIHMLKFSATDIPEQGRSIMQPYKFVSHVEIIFLSHICKHADLLLVP